MIITGASQPRQIHRGQDKFSSRHRNLESHRLKNDCATTVASAIPRIDPRFIATTESVTLINAVVATATPEMRRPRGQHRGAVCTAASAQPVMTRLSANAN